MQDDVQLSPGTIQRLKQMPHPPGVDPIEVTKDFFRRHCKEALHLERAEMRRRARRDRMSEEEAIEDWYKEMGYTK